MINLFYRHLTVPRRPSRHVFTVVLIMIGLLLDPAAGKTLLEHLDSAPKPTFKQPNRLLPLSRWGWSMPYEVRVALCENWGYALEFDGYVTEAAVDDLGRRPQSANARVVALAAQDPSRYPLFVLAHRPLVGRNRVALPADLAAQLYVRDADGNPILDNGQTNTWRLISPEAPDAIYEWAAEGTAAPLRRLRALTPIAVVLNGGEYGQSVYGHSGPFWERDPRVLAAKGERTWEDYLSSRKAHHEGIVTEAVRKALPDRRAYIWYHFGGEPSWNEWRWSHDYKYTRRLGDYPSQSLYYREFNSGWTGNSDLLTFFLCAYAQAAERYGDKLSYNWVCGGWPPGAISGIDRYTGFLKCLYTAGMIGGVAGYFAEPEGMRGDDVGERPPEHLQQMMALGRVHALFSHVEDFLFEGALLPAPGRRIPPED